MIKRTDSIVYNEGRMEREGQTDPNRSEIAHSDVMLSQQYSARSGMQRRRVPGVLQTTLKLKNKESQKSAR